MRDKLLVSAIAIIAVIIEFIIPALWYKYKRGEGGVVTMLEVFGIIAGLLLIASMMIG